MNKFPGAYATKTEPREYKPLKQIYNKQWNWSSIESPNKEKPRARWIHYWILPALQRKPKTDAP
jgi:hypothetical protein